MIKDTISEVVEARLHAAVLRGSMMTGQSQYAMFRQVSI